MARALSNAHRRELRTLTGMAQRDLSAMWTQFDSPASARDLLMDALPRLVAIYGAAAATLGADYYDELRDEAEAPGSFTAIAAETATTGKLDVLARVAVGSLFGATPDPDAALTIASGGLQRHIADADRETVRFSAVQDRAARGWMRVGNGECDWCQRFLDGEVHYTEGYDFAAHDHCGCTAEPVFG
jgi:hypothetical protein